MLTFKKKYSIIFIAKIVLPLFLYSINLNASNLKDSLSDMRIGYTAYSPGVYAPFGVMFGNTSIKGYGLYFSARINKNVFKKSGQYYFDGTALSDHSLNWEYNNEKIYSRYEASIGFIGKISDIHKRFRFSFYSGIGVLRPRYMYSFTQVGLNGISKQQWVLYKEISKLSINTEAGLIFAIRESIILHLGVSGITRKYERMLTLGIGITRTNKSISPLPY